MPPLPPNLTITPTGEITMGKTAKFRLFNKGSLRKLKNHWRDENKDTRGNVNLDTFSYSQQ